jgi:hypothetical protein
LAVTVKCPNIQCIEQLQKAANNAQEALQALLDRVMA